MKIKKRPPVLKVVEIPPPLVIAKKPVKRIVETYHPRYGYIKREVIE
jgi:hypothetical protein